MTHRLLLACPLLLAAACTDPGSGPSTNPPPPWGVPITGGTILVTRDGSHVVVADPDRDRVLSVELAGQQAIVEVPMLPGDEPGRLVEDGAGRVHVAMRRGGAVVTLDRDAHMIDRQAVCGEPRGVAWDAATDLVHVACAGGELVSMPAAGGAPTRRLHLDRDLRDVVVSGDSLIVTRFRTAEFLTIDATGAVISRQAPPPLERFGIGGKTPEIPAFPAVPAVAWRAIGLPDGRVLMSHQRQLQGTLGTTDDGYDGGCGGRAQAALTTARAGELPVPVRTGFVGTLPVDVAFSPRGDRFAVVVAGDRSIHVFAASDLDQPDQGEPCMFPPDTDTAAPGGGFHDDLGAPTSAAYTPTGELVIFYPELPGLTVRTDTGARTITLPGPIGYDAGRALFHRQTDAKLACASCHPEGGDDGLVWDFVDLGRRRTQNLAGHIQSRAPYHWSGDMTDLPTLMQLVFSERMAGGRLTDTELASLGPWLDRLRPLAPATGDDVAIARGKALFDSGEVGCATCHAGPMLTNNMLFDVGTGNPGEAFKVPSLLGVGNRPPYMHNGCAPTLADRFGACGGGDLHGHTSQLSAADKDDLIAYLGSL